MTSIYNKMARILDSSISILHEKYDDVINWKKIGKYSQFNFEFVYGEKTEGDVLFKMRTWQNMIYTRTEVKS